jgi:hypothetical protein
LVRSLLAHGIEVMIEPWPKRLSKDSPLARPYPPVNWIIRELFYETIQLNPKAGEEWAPLESVVGKIYRIVPSPASKVGRDEIADINTIRVKHDLPKLDENNPSQQIVNEIREDGHIPMVRARQLASGDVT